MKLGKFLLATTLALTPLAASAAESDEQRQLVIMAIQLKGYACGSVLEVAELEEPVAYNVTCSAEADGSGATTLYFVQIAGGDIVVEPQ
ncbi:MAG TPA: hypothetical protein VLA51_01920 [Paracoccaceae bacterium]|nr:hypothetical protein [Paracoccaceae bacterium]